MTVTVCIPAFRAAAFIGETVKSVLEQTHGDLRLLIGIEPLDHGGPDETLEALEAFLPDPRLTVVTNSDRLGWAENIDALLRRVKTQFYAILPHDDVWAPRYLATLLPAVTAQPEAVVAYGDLYYFGSGSVGRKAVVLPSEEDRGTHLLRFLLQGAEAMPWRGVTRSSSLIRTSGFPVDGHRGFAVECEYALALLAAGRAVHVPRVLYFKRKFPRHEVTASSARLVGIPMEERRAGWQEHCRRMSALLDQALTAIPVAPGRADLCRAALVGAMLRRLQLTVANRLEKAELHEAASALQACEVSDDVHASATAANLHIVIYQHWRAAGDPARAAEHAQIAWSLDKRSPGAAVAVAETLFTQGRLHEALELAAEAIGIAPDHDRGAASALVSRIYARLGWSQSG